jgi:hypothetical protein
MLVLILEAEGNSLLEFRTVTPASNICDSCTGISAWRKLSAAIWAFLRPFWICRVQREEFFVHFGFAEYGAKNFSSILDLQSTARRIFRPFWI